MRFFLVSICVFLCIFSSMYAQESHSTLFGHNDALLYGRYWSDSEEGREGKKDGDLKPDVYQICKAYPALFSTDIGRIEHGHLEYWAGVTFEQVRQAMIRHHKSGGLVTVSWHVRNPEHGLSYIYDEDYKGTVARILKREGRTYNTFMLYLSRVADFLLQVRDADGQLIPIIFRPWHECNGNWFWWGTADCSAEEYVALWRLTHDYLTNRGLSNLKYAFSPGSWFWSKEEYMQRFPGHEYVDIIGVECYRQKNTGIVEGRKLFYTNLRRNFRMAEEIADSLGLPYALTETGMQANSDAEWWTKGLMPALEGFRPMFVNFWSNQWIKLVPQGGTWCTFPGELSAKDFRKFYKKNKKMFIKKLKRI